jgi:hypothetical protein
LLYTTRRPTPELRGSPGLNRNVSVMLGAIDGNGNRSTPPGTAAGTGAELDAGPDSCELESCAAKTGVAASDKPAPNSIANTRRIIRCHLAYRPQLRNGYPPKSKCLG